ncbi:hypothetical protein BCR36DRAFT_587518 [Piromyces finnis]|uniref:SMAD/FHA domain-containing protein n=1 Tax=Piromyces finnis TaxID=1754191 RepID=A0A1Y1UVR5_9FUNG|nr:hypothetical protein BCR36DRAFT_587518 [Piromyces finnis]|eukprot:ORX42031.1 hypothetical protein BCR36DRAFT_587518 [Piromyces finnis]
MSISMSGSNIIEDNSNVPVVSIQFVSYPDTSRSPNPLTFDKIERDLIEGMVVKIGRQVNRPGNNNDNIANDNAIWFKSKVVSRSHAEIWAKDGQVYLKDTASSSGTFLNHMRLSPSGKESRPYPLKDNDIIQLGIDYQGKSEDIYKCVIIKIVIVNRKVIQQRRQANPTRFRAALKALLSATNPYSSHSGDDEINSKASVDCCICLCGIGPFQALFVAPCSHCFHYKCVTPLLSTGNMFQCPLCRQVANLVASVSMESFSGLDDDIDTNGLSSSPGILSSTPITTLSTTRRPCTTLRPDESDDMRFQLNNRMNNASTDTNCTNVAPINQDIGDLNIIQEDGQSTSNLQNPIFPNNENNSNSNVNNTSIPINIINNDVNNNNTNDNGTHTNNNNLNNFINNSTNPLLDDTNPRARVLTSENINMLSDMDNEDSLAPVNLNNTNGAERRGNDGVDVATNLMNDMEIN